MPEFDRLQRLQSESNCLNIFICCNFESLNRIAVIGESHLFVPGCAPLVAECRNRAADSSRRPAGISVRVPTSITLGAVKRIMRDCCSSRISCAFFVRPFLSRSVYWPLYRCLNLGRKERTKKEEEAKGNRSANRRLHFNQTRSFKWDARSRRMKHSTIWEM